MWKLMNSTRNGLKKLINCSAAVKKAEER